MKLEKVLRAITVAGLIISGVTLGVGLITKNKIMGYIGGGALVIVTCEYISTSGNKPYERK